MFKSELQELTTSLLEIIKDKGLPVPDNLDWQPIPFSGHWGFGSPVCFQIAAQEARLGRKVNVPTRAQELAEELALAWVGSHANSHLEAERGYLNLYFQNSEFAQRVVDAVLQEGDSFGRGEAKAERWMVEYAQPNTHHSFHIGHARNAMLGEALARIAEYAGYETLRASYPGDIGLGVITCVWAYQKFYSGQEPEGIHERGQWLAKIYTEANALLTPSEGEDEQDRLRREAFDAERREMLRHWDEGDPEVRELWQRTRQWSLDELYAILELLGIHMDVFFFESEVDEPSKAIVTELIRVGLAVDERPSGPVIINIDEQLGLTKEKFRTAVILRSDGTTLYLTKDLALAKEKFEKYKVDRSIYVVDTRQSLHFQQAFKILELWGFPQAEKCHHLAYGFVTLPEGTMSSRKGNVILFMDVLAEAERRVHEIIAEKNPDLPVETRPQIARQVGLGALTYSMLAVDNIRDIVFDWDQALSFEGQSAPYIQNAYVRAGSILKRSEVQGDSSDFTYELDSTEIDLIESISHFPEVVQRAALEFKPLVMATYVYDLAKSFHMFYHAVRVLQAEEPAVRASRLRLTAAARQTLANALGLLGIQLPEVM